MGVYLEVETVEALEAISGGTEHTVVGKFDKVIRKQLACISP